MIPNDLILHIFKMLHELKYGATNDKFTLAQDCIRNCMGYILSANPNLCGDVIQERLESNKTLKIDKSSFITTCKQISWILGMFHSFNFKIDRHLSDNIWFGTLSNSKTHNELL